MTEAKHGQSTSTFVIRFWRDSSANDSGEGGRWYGQVEHVQSGQRRAFQSAEQMLRFMHDYVNIVGGSPPIEPDTPSH